MNYIEAAQKLVKFGWEWTPGGYENPKYKFGGKPLLFSLEQACSIERIEVTENPENIVKQN